MPDSWFIVRSFSLFYRYKPVKLLMLFLITLFLGFNQGITIVLLVPLLGLLDPVSGSSDTWTGFMHRFFDRMGWDLNIEVILALFALCLLSVALLHYIQSLIQTTYQQEFSNVTRKRLFKKIIASPWQFLNGKSKHNHIQVLTTEVPKMTMYYHYFLGLATKCLFIVAHVVLALMISVPFTLFVTGCGLVIFILLRTYLTKAEFLGNTNVQVARDMLKRIDDFWLTVKIAKVHQSEEFYYRKFDEASGRMLRNQYLQNRNRAFPQLLFSIAGVAALLVLIYLSYRVAHLPLTSLFVLILLFARIFPQFSGLSNDLNMMVSNTASVKMVLELDREMEERDFETHGGANGILFGGQLAIRDLSFGYPGKALLFDRFSESIPAYQITGIVGKSGCGKTTLIDIVAGLQSTPKPVLFADDVPLTAENLPAWRSHLGYLPQDSFFIDGTLRENLLWDTRHSLTDEQIFEVLRSVNADHLVSGQKQGLDTFIVNYPYHFSGGERQRLALARVLIRKPCLLLLDEATSALDPENEQLIMDCLTHLKKSVTILFVTHRQYLSASFDKVIHLNGGLD